MIKKTILIKVLLCIFCAGCAIVPITGRRQLSFVPQSQLLSLSNDNYKQVIKDSKISTSADQTQMVVAVGKKIAASAETFMRENKMEADLKNYQWEFNLIDDPKTVNAFCMPGGKIVVYTGILAITQNESGLAAVVSHEVAHAIANHGGERMSQQLLVQLGEVGLSKAIAEKPEKTKQIMMLAYGAGTNLGVLLPYSRSHESEADHIGLILMARAGYNPEDAIQLWERMSQLSTVKQPEFLSTHPATQKRIEDLRKELPEALKYYSG
jgi:predicted Zn-dependent protease